MNPEFKKELSKNIDNRVRHLGFVSASGRNTLEYVLVCDDSRYILSFRYVRGSGKFSSALSFNHSRIAPLSRDWEKATPINDRWLVSVNQMHFPTYSNIWYIRIDTQDTPDIVAIKSLENFNIYYNNLSEICSDIGQLAYHLSYNTYIGSQLALMYQTRISSAIATSIYIRNFDYILNIPNYYKRIDPDMTDAQWGHIISESISRINRLFVRKYISLDERDNIISAWQKAGWKN